LIDKVESFGGAVAAIERGWLAEQIAESAYRFQQQVERGERTVVGVNKYAEDAAGRERLELLRVNPALGQRRAESLRQFRVRRDPAALQSALAELGEAASGTANLMPPTIAAVRAGATVGEIADALRQVFGIHTAGGYRG
jgi:methylmalonyl-CoA mutase N-terminal domain/subunit